MHRPLSICLLAAAGALPACGGGLPARSGTTATLGAPASGMAPLRRRARARVRFAIKIPRRLRVHGRYVSPATKSVSIAFYSTGSTTPAATIERDVTSSTGGCSESPSAVTCTFTIALAPGSYSVDATTYDETSESGNALSAMNGYPLQVTAGQTNELSVTLGGIPWSIEILPPSSPTVSGTQANGFTIFNRTPLAFTIAAKDADGYVITGNGAPTITLSPAPADMTVATPAPGSNTWTLTSTYAATDPTIAATSTLWVNAIPVSGSDGSQIGTHASLTLDQNWFYVAQCAGAYSVFDDLGQPKSLSPGFSSDGYARGVAYDSHNKLVYFANTNATISAFDRLGHLQTLSGTFSQATEPAGMIFDPGNDEIYVTNYDKGGVYAFNEDGTSAASSGGFPNTLQPFAIAYDSHNHFLYVANYGTGTPYDAGVTVYDESGNQQPISWTGTDKPDGIAYDSHNGLIYVANYQGSGSTAISVFNESGALQTVTAASPWDLAFAPVGIAFDPHNDLIYVTNYSSAPSPVTPGVTVYDEEGNLQTQASGAFSGTGSSNQTDGIAVVP